MFLKIMHEKTISKAKIDETQEKQEFQKWLKEYQWYFLKLLSKNKTTIFLRGPKRKLIEENQD